MRPGDPSQGGLPHHHDELARRTSARHLLPARAPLEQNLHVRRTGSSARRGPADGLPRLAAARPSQPRSRGDRPATSAPYGPRPRRGHARRDLIAAWRLSAEPRSEDRLGSSHQHNIKQVPLRGNSTLTGEETDRWHRDSPKTRAAASRAAARTSSTDTHEARRAVQRFVAAPRDSRHQITGTRTTALPSSPGSRSPCPRNREAYLHLRNQHRRLDRQGMVRTRSAPG